MRARHGRPDWGQVAHRSPETRGVIGRVWAAEDADAATEASVFDGEAAPTNVKGVYDDGWGSQMQEWEGDDAKVMESKGSFPSLPVVVILMAAVTFVCIRLIGMFQSQQISKLGHPVPTTETVREQDVATTLGRSDRHQAAVEQGQDLLPSLAVETSTSNNGALESSQVSELPGRHGNADSEGGPTDLGSSQLHEGWTLAENENNGSEEIIEQNVPEGWAQSNIEGAVHEVEDDTSVAPALTPDNDLSLPEEASALSSRYSIRSLRERAQLAARAATAASDAAQMAAAYSSAAASAASAAAAAAERATTAAGSVQIAVENGAEEAIAEAGVRAAKAVEAAAQAESRAASAAAMAAGYQDSAEAQATFAQDAADVYPSGDAGLMQRWHQWWLSVWAHIANTSHRLGMAAMAWFTEIWLAFRQASMWAAGMIRRIVSKYTRPFNGS